MHLVLDDFPLSKTIHIIAPIGATFLRQRATQLRASSKRPRVEPSSVAPLPPTSTSDTTADASVDLAAAAAAIPPPSTSDDSDIQRMLEIVMTIQVAHGQILVDMLNELRDL